MGRKIVMHLLLLVLILTLSLQGAIFGKLVPAATWWVDSVNGSDFNNGTSPSTPFQTISKVMEQTTLDKQCIALARGSHWREKMSLPGNGVCVVAYGSGARPLLDASDTISTMVWSKTAGRTNIYQATVSTDNELTAFLRAWEDGTAMPKATSLDNLDSSAGKYWTATDGGSSYVLYVHSTGSGNPASNGKTYEYNRRTYGLFSQYERNTVSGIHTRRNLGNNGSFELGRFAFVNDSVCEEGTKHCALAKEGSTWVDFTALNSMYFPNESRIALVLFDNASAGYDTLFKRVTYTENLEAGVGFFGHDSTGNLTGTVTLKDCVTNGSVGASTSISGFNSPRMVVEGGNLNAAISLGSATSIVRDATVGGQLGIPYAGVSAEIDGVTATCNCTNGIVNVANNIAVTALNVQDSSFSNTNDFDGSIYIGTGSTIGTLTLLNNTYAAPVQTNHIGGPGAANLPAGATINGNTYHYPSMLSTWINYRGVTYDISGAGWAAWQALGVDASGQRITP